MVGPLECLARVSKCGNGIQILVPFKTLSIVGQVCFPCGARVFRKGHYKSLAPFYLSRANARGNEIPQTWKLRKGGHAGFILKTYVQRNLRADC